MMSKNERRWSWSVRMIYVSIALQMIQILLLWVVALALLGVV